MQYKKLSNLIIVSREKGKEKMTAAKYLAVIIDREMFDF
jgi:hypothetical protein